MNIDLTGAIWTLVGTVLWARSKSPVSCRSCRNRCGKWAPANNMEYIGYASVKISDRTGSADFMIFNLFSAGASPGLRIHCPGFAAETEFKRQRLLLPLVFDRRFSSPWTRRTSLAADAKGRTPHLLGQPGTRAFLPLLLTSVLLLFPPPRRLPAYPNTSRLL